MKPTLLVLAALLLGGCTTITLRTSSGAQVRFSSSKNIKLDRLTFDPDTGRISLEKLESDASSVVREQGAVAATAVKALVP